VLEIETTLLPGLRQLRNALGAKERQFGAVIKIGRTHMQVRLLLVLVVVVVVVVVVVPLLLPPPLLLTPPPRRTPRRSRSARCSRVTARSWTTASGGRRRRCRRCTPWLLAAPLSARA